MDPRLAELTERLASSRSDLAAAVGAVPAARRGEAPAEGRWSVSQVLEHLGIVEGNITRVLGTLLAKALARSGDDRFDAQAFGSHIDMPAVLDRTRRRQNSPASEPSGGLDADEAWRTLEKTRPALLEAMRRGEGSDLEQASQPHPALGPLTAYQWISFLAYHEARHAAQIREIGEQMQSPAP